VGKGKSNWLVRKVVVNYCSVSKNAFCHMKICPHTKRLFAKQANVEKKYHISIFLGFFLSEYFIINFTISVFTPETQDFIFPAQC